MKHRTPLVLLLSAALIVLGALLPGIVGKQQDAANDGEILFATINDVQLEFAESDVTLMETVSILCGNTEMVDIPEELASLNRDTVVSLATEAADAYWQAEIAFRGENYDSYSFEIMSCQPVLVYSSRDDGKSSIFWTVNVGSIDRSQVMSMAIDDRTGTICSVDYSDGNADYTKNQMKNILYSFSDVYLAELGEEFYDFNSNDILSSAKSPIDNSYLASEITWWADSYEYKTTFFVNTHGFYTYLAVVAY